MSLRGAPADLPFKLDAKTIEMGMNFTLNTRFGPLDLLGYVEPIGGYEELLRNMETYPAETYDLRTVGLDDLVRIKEHIGRQKDTESLEQLRAIQSKRKGR